MKPPSGSGIGTAAAMKRADCQTDDKVTSPYGYLDSALQGQGPVCVKPWKEGDDNGGATSSGVTADAITLVALVPSEAQATATGATQRATKAKGKYQDAFHDLLLPLMRYYETWGRDIDLRFVESSGVDEAAQRADAVRIKEMEPFAVMDVVPAGLDVLDAELANSKILTFGYATSFSEALQQAPYRWGHSDTQANASNGAEVIGKQLAKKKAVYGGDDVKSQTRKFGLVYVDDILDVDQFKKTMTQYGAQVAVESPFDASGSTLGDPASAQQQAPTIVAEDEGSGVTTVILVTDVAMSTALMNNANQQEWSPEWFFTGTLFADLPLLARQYAPEQMAHAFGNATTSPWVIPNPNPTEADDLPHRPRRPPQLVLGSRHGHVVAGRGPGSPLGDARHPRRRAEAHAEDVPAGPVRAGAALRRRVRLPDRGDAGLRQDRRALRTTSTSAPAPTSCPSGGTPSSRARVPARAPRARATPYFLDGAKRYRAGAGADEAVHVLQREGHGRVLRRAPDPDAGPRPRVHGLPEPGRRGHAGDAEPRWLRRTRTWAPPRAARAAEPSGSGARHLPRAAIRLRG